MNKNKKFTWQFKLGIILLVIATILYSAVFFFYHDSSRMLQYMLTDLDFLPLEILFVSLILQRLISQREKMNMLKKLNMVIGAFFSEVGIGLMKEMIPTDTDLVNLGSELHLGYDWQASDFQKAIKTVHDYEYTLNIINPEHINRIKGYLQLKRNFMLRLLENPNLLEHESFTELLWAVFHLTDELGARKEVTTDLEADYKHLVIDLQRAYRLLTIEWITYMQHLKKDYPYLYSFAVRTNPFNPEVTPEIKG